MLPMTLAEAQEEKFEYVRAKGQRSLFLVPCRSPKLQKKSKPKLQEVQQIRGRIFSKKGRMMRMHQEQFVMMDKDRVPPDIVRARVENGKTKLKGEGRIHGKRFGFECRRATPPNLGRTPPALMAGVG